MPFKIIRNDITNVKADAIVNSANPKPTFDQGTDYAIYHAAGVGKLLEARRMIGNINRGEVRATAAFNLKAQYIIHTVGPVWLGGDCGEYETLKKCYQNSLNLAVKLKCESIAFPLISTGVYGFPKDKALEIAISSFSRFLMTEDIDIILVVFDKDSYRLSEKIVGEIDSFIDSNYIDKKKSKILAKEEISTTRESNEKGKIENERTCLNLASLKSEPQSETKQAKSLEDEFDNIGASFHDILLNYIINSGMGNSEIWHRANMDRKLFSKIMCSDEYHPKKKTVMSLCIALKLNLQQSKDLMSRADWAFSPSSKFDLIVQKSILDKQYDIMKLNMVLFKYTDDIL